MTRPRDIADGINRIDTSAADATAITIDANENVGIGTSSPTRPLSVERDSSSSIISTFKSANAQGAISLRGSATTSDTAVRFAAEGNDLLSFAGGSEAMRLDSSGNLLVGKTSNDFATSGFVANANGIGATRSGGACLQINRTSSDGSIQEFYKDGTIVGNIGSGGGGITFGAGSSGTERMRISATSNALSIGKTTFGTAGVGYTVYGNTAPQCYFVKSNSGAVNGILFYHNTTYVGGLNYDNTNTSLATSSDERLKDNIENSDDAGAKIDAMQVRQFDWKSTGEHQEYGFVAQELEPVFAHAVHTDKEGDYKSVDYACLVPMLVKEIQSLRQRITDLENA